MTLLEKIMLFEVELNNNCVMDNLNPGYSLLSLGLIMKVVWKRNLLQKALSFRCNILQ
jgi:hypothetical protein